ncbi:glycosyltransferase [Bacillus timonensis]|nr:glycosyltransferase [Bacillus timonensis]
MMTFLLVLSMAHCIFIIWTLVNMYFLPSFSRSITVENENPFVSLLIPLRNEERNVKDLLESISQLTYPNLEILLLDDHSTDQTRFLLEKYTRKLHHSSIIDGKKLPVGWVGKVHACKQLSQVAKGDYYLFIDADVRLQSDAIERAITLMTEHQAKLLSGFPTFPTTTLLSKLLVPMQHFVVLFHLPLFIANKTTLPSTTAAHGSFMLIEKKAYHSIGGHNSVATSLIEDVELARNLKRTGHKVLIASITAFVTCYMYETNREVWHGFTKNIYKGLGESPVLVFFLTLFYTNFYLSPLFLVFFFPTYGLLAIAPLVLSLFQRYIVDKVSHQPTKWIFTLMPFSALSLIAVMNVSMWKSFFHKPHEWKGRFYL